MKTIDFPQLALMREGIEYKFEIKVRSFVVKVRPLTNLEIIEATAKAAEAYEMMPEKTRSSISLSLMLAMYQLERASSPDIGEIGALSMPLMQLMNNEELNSLWKQYVRVTDLINPSFENMDSEEVEKVVEELKKNSDQLSRLTDLSISQLIAVCSYLLKAPAV